MDKIARETLRSSESEGGCFGGLRRRNEGYHGFKPVEASFELCVGRRGGETGEVAADCCWKRESYRLAAETRGSASSGVI
ncbi:MAG: hypothetical protein IH856_05815 [Deltaproteobacteria bacterium]|nr:hypothetical protein [Deltaproteobacteria bacterium]MCZ6562615.1 hypothetical protein [Deltaproteobacteria bacterium]